MARDAQRKRLQHAWSNLPHPMPNGGGSSKSTNNCNNNKGHPRSPSSNTTTSAGSVEVTARTSKLVCTGMGLGHHNCAPTSTDHGEGGSSRPPQHHHISHRASAAAVAAVRQTVDSGASHGFGIRHAPAWHTICARSCTAVRRRISASSPSQRKGAPEAPSGYLPVLYRRV